MEHYNAYIRRATARYGDQLDTSGLAARFRPLLGTDTRVRVARTYADGYVWTRTGLVGVTTGWRPAFILMARVDSMGSLLSAEDRIVGIKRAGERVYRAMLQDQGG